MSAAAGSASSAQYVSFLLAGVELAVKIAEVREIVEYDVITAVPLTPPCILGVMNLRGRVIPVIDLARKFGLPDTEVTRLTCVLLMETPLEGELLQIGVLVDAVGEVLELCAEDIEEAPEDGSKIGKEYLSGAARVGERLVRLFDMARILSMSELFASPPSEADSATDRPAGGP